MARLSELHLNNMGSLASDARRFAAAAAGCLEKREESKRIFGCVTTITVLKMQSSFLVFDLAESKEVPILLLLYFSRFFRYFYFSISFSG